ncbi:HD-GYP domain-containing protein [Paenibacillus ginsengarvi]|uniref:HD domain-containing protein n=1 Tax=Paenibacillus ginsengarvi TaxID=400777 RepID=A0A3B0AK54_9BACL|nr:HD domain-containing phosphohydrolase [Paenibacillus ginsengarvi]RKN60781.1 HD domain-containing protein [Paenibacillus ginsengarvi]
MRCDTYNELVGKKLIHNVVTATGMVLIPEHTILTDSHIEKLEKFGIDLFDIQVELVEEPAGQEPPKPSRITEEAAELPVLQTVRVDAGILAKRANAKLQEIETCILNTGKIPLSDIEENVLPTIMEATQSWNIYKLFADLKAEGDFRFKHSIGVAFMSAVLGRWLGLDEQETANLAIAASLSDIGTIRLPSTLLQKQSELLPHEREILKQHTILGYEILKGSGLDERVALVALQHHEREDGSGYPYGIKSAEIDRFSKIVAMSDEYLAMSSEWPLRPTLPFYKVIQRMNEDIVKNRFDSVIGMTFINRLMSAQVGSDVSLTDGRRGKIVLIHPNYPTRPLIALEGAGFIDLNKTDSVQINEIFG